MPSSSPTSYDQVLYQGSVQHQTHPDRFATLATLYGMRPAPVEHCRVLEIACGDGINPISMGVCLPGSRFLGIDLAPSGIVAGQKIIAALGLKNVELRTLDLMAITAELGKFDYIIAHGLYSWVPQAVRDQLLAVCKLLLAPQGVAYISYNVYPGCHVRQMLREMLRFHVRQNDSPQDKIAEARKLAQFLADAQIGDDIDKQFYLRELEKLLGHPDHLLFHDDLADINAPSYFVQFIAHAGQHGLQFLAEVDYCEMQDIFYPDPVVAALRKVTAGQVLLKEQYLDFVKLRRFRRTLLCHQDVALDRDLQPAMAQRFLASSSAAPVSAQPDIRTDAEEEFAGRTGGYLRSNQPIMKALLVVLSEAWPAPLSFRELHAKVKALLGPDEQAANPLQDTSVPALENVLMNAVATGLVHFHVHLPRYARQPSARPVASPLARWQIGQGRTAVTNLFHTSVDIIEPLGRQLIKLLDGSRDRARLHHDLLAAAEAGTLTLEEHGEPIRDPRRTRTLIDRDLDPSLTSLGRLALLIH